MPSVLVEGLDAVGAHTHEHPPVVPVGTCAVADAANRDAPLLVGSPALPAHGVEADAGECRQRMTVLREDLGDHDVGAVMLLAKQSVASSKQR